MGVKFSTASRSKGDAQILFRSQEDLNTVLAGQIQEIFAHKRFGEDGSHITDYFLSVRKYKELSPAEAAFDPYRRFPLLDMRLCHDQLSSDIIVISVDDVISHFASCPFEMTENITGDLRVILSLDRVSTSLVEARASIHIIILELINSNPKAVEYTRLDFRMHISYAYTLPKDLLVLPVHVFHVLYICVTENPTRLKVVSSWLVRFQQMSPLERNITHI